MKKVFATLLLILIAFSVQASTYYGFKLGGVAVNSDNCNNITGSNIKANDPTKPFSAVYNRGTLTLTLTNVKIERTGSDNRCIYVESEYVNVKFAGDNVLSARDAAPVRTCFDLSFACLDGGSVTINGGSEDAIYITDCPASYTSLTTVKFGKGNYKINASGSYGIHGTGSNTRVEILGDAKVDIYGSKGDLYNLGYAAIIAGNPIDQGDSEVILRHNPNNTTAQVRDVDNFFFSTWDQETWSYLSGNDYMIVSPLGAYFAPAFDTFVLPGGLVAEHDIVIANAMPVDAEHFPDSKFRNIVASYGKTFSGFITNAERRAVTSLNINSRSISSLAGIQYFYNLQSLYCGGNHLTSLDLSKNSELTTLSCPHNQLPTINLSSNPKLTTLACFSNQLTSLNLDDNPEMVYLYCQDNKLTDLTINHCFNLKTVYCYNNNLSELVLPYASPLEDLRCNNNNLQELDLRISTLLTHVDISNNPISQFNCGINSIEYLLCHDCNLKYLYLYHNPSLKELHCYGNNINDSTQLMISYMRTLSEENPAKVFFIDRDNSNERNTITDHQLGQMLNKHYIPYYRKDGVWREITVTIPGDVDGDGHVSSVDVTALYNWLLNNDDSAIVNGDQDGDGHISSVDVTAVYNILLGN